MRLGELVIYQDRPYLLIGLDPMSVAGRRVELEDAHTGEQLWAPFDALGGVASAGLEAPVRPRLAERPLS